MKIRQIQIDGFGRFSGVGYGTFAKSVTIFLGPNEAGKSTLLEFVRRTLFGFPRSTASVNPYPALAGGSYGGQLSIEDSDGRLYHVQRTSGNRYSGAVTVTSSSGEQLPEAILTALLGNHSRDVFEKVFAFTLNELYSDDLLKDEHVNSQIYSAGLGVSSLQKAVRLLDSERESLFLNRGRSNQQTYIVSNKIDDVDKRLQDVSDNATRYGQLTTRLQQVENDLEGLAENQRQIRSRYRHQLNLKNAWNDWNDLESAESELTELPVIDDFPSDGVNRLEKLEDRIRVALQEFESANIRVSDAKRKSQIELEHEEILNSSSDIQRLRNERTAFDNAVEDLPKRQAELERRSNDLADALKDLGPDWDEARLQEFDLSIAVRQQIAEYRDRLRQANDDNAHRMSILNQQKTSLKEATDAENRARRSLESLVKPRLDMEQIQQQRSILRATRSQLTKINQYQQDKQNLERQLEGLHVSASPTSNFDRSRAVGAASFTIGVGIVLGGAILGAAALLIGIIAGMALIGAAIFLIMSGRSKRASTVESPLAGPIRDSISDTQDMIQDLQSKLTQQAEPLGLDQIDEESLLATEDSIDQEESLLREWNSRVGAFNDAKDLSKQRQSQMEESTAGAAHARRKHDKSQQEWQDWLRSRGLLETFTPDVVEVLERQVKLGRTQLEDVRSWQQRIATIKKFIDEYVGAVEPLATAFGVAYDRNDHRSVAVAADRLVELLVYVGEGHRQRNSAESELEDAESQLGVRKNQLKEAQEELLLLLKSGGSVDAEAFRKRSELFERRTGLGEKAKSSLVRLQRISGPGEPLAKLKAALAKTNYQSIVDKETALEGERSDIDSKINELSSESGSIKTELERLMDEEDSSRLRMERHVLLEQMNNHAHKWTRLTLAKKLLEMARQKFEKERQPGVIRHAESFFTHITKGQYTQVYSPLGEQTITVADDSGRAKQPSELSRGTREQLFLSLRFGLIHELGQRAEPLPVVVDEVLVNFDPDRALSAAVAFTELSITNQILVFTCHPTTVDLFNKAASEIGAEQPDIVTIS